MKTFITTDQVLDGITLEEVMDELGAIKCLSLQGRQKLSIIEDITGVFSERLKLRGKVFQGMTAEVFDQMYDLPISALNNLHTTAKEMLHQDRCQHQMSGIVDPSGPIQGQDF